jgi:DNA-binding MarR family transcriptional regulator
MTSTVSNTLLAAARKSGSTEELRCQALLEYAATTQAFQTALQRDLALAGLTEPGFAILATLRASKEQALYRSDLGSVTGLSPMRVESAVSRLETSRLVDRHRDPADRRLVLLRLNAMGRERLEHALRQYVVTVTNIMGSLNPADLSACLELSEKIRGGATASIGS